VNFIRHIGEYIKMTKKIYPHYVAMDLHNDGVAHDILLLKEDELNGDIYFVKVEDLDSVDKMRVTQILNRRNARSMPLWDVMSQVTLKNGMNALTYFHQLTKIRTSQGKIIPVTGTRRGLRGPVQKLSRSAPERYEPRGTKAPEQAEEPAEEPKKRGPGRPPKKKTATKKTSGK